MGYRILLMKKSLCLFPIFLLLSCSDSNTPVGTGAAFSTLTSLPSGQTFFDALSASIYLSLQNGLGRERGFDEFNRDFPCLGGGVSKSRATIYTPLNQLDGVATLSNCVIGLVLNTVTYNEIVSGSTQFTPNLDSFGNITWTASWKLTVSGDLGFAADCSSILHAQANYVNQTINLTCTFLDSEGTKIELSGPAVNSLFLAIPPT